MDVRTLVFEEAGFGNGTVSVASLMDGLLHIDLSLRLAAAPPPSGLREVGGDIVCVVGATSSGLNQLANAWDHLLVIGVADDPDTFVADLNRRRYGDHAVWVPEAFDPYDVERGFDDYRTVPLGAGDDRPAAAGTDAGIVRASLPLGMTRAHFEERLLEVLTPFEWEMAARRPRVIGWQFAQGKPLVATPRFTRSGTDEYPVYENARQIYALDPVTARTEILTAIETIFGEF
ncbi:MAG: hypothetical protein K2X57_29090 [Xanthobacteraceae bacterium]|nr:hypothetical protein [Xanthobacteraceae bacterium]